MFLPRDPFEKKPFPAVIDGEREDSFTAATQVPALQEKILSTQLPEQKDLAHHLYPNKSRKQRPWAAVWSPNDTLRVGEMHFSAKACEEEKTIMWGDKRGGSISKRWI